MRRIYTIIFEKYKTQIGNLYVCKTCSSIFSYNSKLLLHISFCHSLYHMKINKEYPFREILKSNFDSGGKKAFEICTTEKHLRRDTMFVGS